jgi:hypothetical protein
MTASIDRINWLETVYTKIRSGLLPEAPPIDQVAIAYSMPHRSSKPIGQYLHRKPSKNERGLILIHPRIWDDPVRVAATLAHEMIHATYPEAGHRGPFVHAMRRIGLEGKPTATVSGIAFEQWFDEIKWPPFPKGDLETEKRPKQTTRLRKWICSCGVIVRAATDELDATCNRCEKHFYLEVK